MAVLETSLANAFETQLTANVTDSDTTFPVASIGSLTSPTYLVVDPDNPTKREYVLFDGVFTSTDLVTSVLANRGLPGSASGAQGHTKGAKVRAVPMQQHFEDLHDRMDTAYTVGGADVAVADGGTGASTAAVARTNLGAAADAEVVHLAGAETITGAKTFSTDPVLADGSSALSLTEGNAAYKWMERADADTYGDGATAAATHLQGLIDTVSAAGGGIVFLPEGTYLVGTALSLPSKVHIVGAGVGVTTIKTTGNVDAIRSSTYSTLTGTANTGGDTQFGLARLTIDGDKANNLTAGSGVKLYGHSFRIEDVHIRNCRERGLVTEWALSDSPADTSTDFIESFMSRVKVHDCVGDGIVWGGPHDSVWDAIISYHNGGSAAGSCNIRVQTAGNSLLATSCHAWGSYADYAWKLEGRARLVNCTGEGGRVAQVLVLASDSSVDGEFFADALFKSVKGIVLGDGTTNPARTMVNAAIRDCESGGIDFTNDAGKSTVIASVEQSAGSAYIGTPTSDSVIVVKAGGVSGVTNSLYRFPSGPFRAAAAAFTSPAASSTPVLLQGASGQTAALFEWQNSAATRLGRVTSDGRFIINEDTAGAIPGNIGGALIASRSAANPPLILRGASGHTGTLLSVQNNAGTGLLSVSADGSLVLSGALDHDGSTIGFYGTAPVTKPSLTYSRTGETTAEAQLRAALSALGLVADNTTA